MENTEQYVTAIDNPFITVEMMHDFYSGKRIKEEALELAKNYNPFPNDSVSLNEEIRDRFEQLAFLTGKSRGLDTDDIYISTKNIYAALFKQGLLNHRLKNPDNVKEREAVISFLNDVMTQHFSFILELSVKPDKIDETKAIIQGVARTICWLGTDTGFGFLSTFYK